MKKRKNLSGMALRAKVGLSEKDLVRYLRQQANLNKDKHWGNPALAHALEQLAKKLEGESRQLGDNQQAEFDLCDLPSGEDIKRLDLSKIAEIVSDEQRTRAQLIELAFARFSIPRSRLQRMPLADIRDVIQGAIEHEASITIIGREAERQGSDRRS